MPLFCSAAHLSAHPSIPAPVGIEPSEVERTQISSFSFISRLAVEGFQSVLTFTGFLPLMQVVIDDIMTHSHTNTLSHTLQIMITILPELRESSALLPAIDGCCCCFPPTCFILASGSHVLVVGALSDPLPLSVAALSTGAAGVYLIRGISRLSGNERRHLSEGHEDQSRSERRISFACYFADLLERFVSLYQPLTGWIFEI